VEQAEDDRGAHRNQVLTAGQVGHDDRFPDHRPAGECEDDGCPPDDGEVGEQAHDRGGRSGVEHLPGLRRQAQSPPARPERDHHSHGERTGQRGRVRDEQRPCAPQRQFGQGEGEEQLGDARPDRQV
jgi:hypothetical protein